MLKWMFISLLLLGGALPVAAQNQHELNAAAQADFEKADKELNAVYGQLMKKLDPASQKALVEAELAWIKFRDADALARAAVNQGGSIYPMIYAGSRARTTKLRTLELKAWLKEWE